jgi:hypothetical protein
VPHQDEPVEHNVERSRWQVELSGITDMGLVRPARAHDAGHAVRIGVDRHQAIGRSGEQVPAGMPTAPDREDVTPGEPETVGEQRLLPSHHVAVVQLEG